MMLTDLADVLRAGGLRVVEVAGWKTRTNDGNRLAAVWGILCHWTATSTLAKGDYPSLNIVTNGRSDLPGMLAQLGLGRDGTWYVIGAGVAWHAGAVDRVASDNYHAIGIEAEYHPDQGAWPEAQQRSYERGCAVLAKYYGVPLDQVRGHYEAAVPYGRKPDPNTLPGGMPGFRQRVKALLDSGLEEDMALDFDRDWPVMLRMLDTYIRYSSRPKGPRPTWEDGPTMLEQLAAIREQVGAIAARPVADVDEAALAAELEKRGVGGASPAEVKAAMIAVLRHGTEESA